MKTFIKKLFIFSLPFLIFFLTILIIDPYNYFSFFNVIPIQDKENISYPVNTLLWKVIQFRKNPTANVLFGDSRMHGLDVNLIKRITGEDYFNFGFGGASIPEIYQVFFHADKFVRLRKVYIGLNFNVFNIWNSRNIAVQTIQSINNPFTYLLNLNVCQSTYYIISSFFSNKSQLTGNPGKTKSEFWKYQLNEGIRNYYQNFTYSQPFIKMLAFIAYYCKEKNIELSFIIFPSHRELQAKVTDYGLNAEYDKFKKDLRSLGKVADFDVPHALNSDSSNFQDPFHYNKEYGERIICTVWESVKKIIGKWKMTTTLNDNNPVETYYTFTRSRLVIESALKGNSAFSKTELVMMIKSDDGKKLKLQIVDPARSKSYDIFVTSEDNKRMEIINEHNQLIKLEKFQ